MYFRSIKAIFVVNARDIFCNPLQANLTKVGGTAMTLWMIYLTYRVVKVSIFSIGLLKSDI